MRNGMAWGFGFFLMAGTAVLFAQSLNRFVAGDLVSADTINANFDMLDTKVAIAAPTGAIMAFYLSECPNGWTAADGTGSTPDLRGAFVRGLNSFDGGLTSNPRDPQDTGARSLGHYQTDAFQGHRHATVGYGSGGHPVQRQTGGKLASDEDTGTDPVLDPINGSHGVIRVSTETRPGNVALIYCMRE